MRTFGEEAEVWNFVVGALVNFRVHVVAETQRPQVLVLDHRGPSQDVGEEDLGQVDLEGRLAATLHQLEKLQTVLIIDQPKV